MIVGGRRIIERANACIEDAIVGFVLQYLPICTRHGEGLCIVRLVYVYNAIVALVH